MTPEKQRIAIAEACGVLARSAGFTDEDIVRAGILDRNEIPDYLNDLNAMHEAEKVLGLEESEDYMNQLQAITFQRDGDWGFCHATAAKRAEAFLRTIGKWEEAP